MFAWSLQNSVSSLTDKNLHSRVPVKVGSRSCRNVRVKNHVIVPSKSTSVYAEVTGVFGGKNKKKKKKNLIFLQRIGDGNNISFAKVAHASIEKMSLNSILKQVIVEWLACYFFINLDCLLISVKDTPTKPLSINPTPNKVTKKGFHCCPCMVTIVNTNKADYMGSESLTALTAQRIVPPWDCTG